MFSYDVCASAIAISICIGIQVGIVYWIIWKVIFDFSEFIYTTTDIAFNLVSTIPVLGIH